jgi:PRTRC genetic system protein E
LECIGVHQSNRWTPSSPQAQGQTRWNGWTLTLVLLPNHASAKEFPILGQGISVSADTIEELESKIVAALQDFAPAYESVAEQIEGFQSEAAAALKAAREKAKNASATAAKTVAKPVPAAKPGAKPAIPPKAAAAAAAPPAPSLFGDDPVTPSAAAPAPAAPPFPTFDDDDDTAGDAGDSDGSSSAAEASE